MARSVEVAARQLGTKRAMVETRMAHLDIAIARITQAHPQPLDPAGVAARFGMARAALETLEDEAVAGVKRQEEELVLGIEATQAKLKELESRLGERVRECSSVLGQMTLDGFYAHPFVYSNQARQ
eukprot:TRINITY_DN7990_c0_g1_i1.p4 TRINITY_DN7990_c0_g1~~TRINITY_DN7990_c0_g1_i1.p4  ORF type:complete len:126 (+),score=34.30 TRINITY_DN7990_c0_g1_i1:758-1135(+)